MIGSPPPRRQRWLPLLLWGLPCLVGLSGCESPPPVSEAPIRLAVAQPPLSLDPRYATDAIGSRVVELVHQRLVELGPDLQPVPGLATWQQPEPTRYRFELQGTPRFHDGSALDSGDVVATYRSTLAAGSRSPYGPALGMVDEVRAFGPRVVEFRLSRPDPLFPGRLSLGILPAAQAQQARSPARPLGSGPLRVLRQTPGGVLLERTADARHIELVAVRDPTVRVLKLLKGEVDLLQNDLPPELVRHVARQPGLRVERRRGSNYSYLGFNLDDPLTGELALRQAVALAIDRRALIEHLLAGGARPAGGVLPPEHWAGARDLPPWQHDAQRARALLREHGLLGAELVYKLSNDPLRLRIATVIAAQLEAAGLRVRLQSHEWGTFYGDVKAGRFQMFSLAWVGVHLPDVFRELFHSTAVPPHGANRGRYRSAAVDRLIDTALRLPPARSVPVWHAVQQQLAADLPYVSLWYEDHVLARRAQVCGYRLRADGSYRGLTQVYRSATPCADP